MIRLLQLIFIGHWHTWETIETRDLHSQYGWKGMRYILRCKTCGEVKKVDLI